MNKKQKNKKKSEKHTYIFTYEYLKLNLILYPRFKCDLLKYQRCIECEETLYLCKLFCHLCQEQKTHPLSSLSQSHNINLSN